MRQPQIQEQMTSVMMRISGIEVAIGQFTAAMTLKVNRSFVPLLLSAFGFTDQH
jgi:hypothetical protein